MIRRLKARDFSWERTNDSTPDTVTSVREIVSAVRRDKDAALKHYTKRYDGFEGANDDTYSLRVPQEAMEVAWQGLNPGLQAALTDAASRIRAYHKLQVPDDLRTTGLLGETLGMVWRSIQRVGVYAPGGRGAYPSTVLMDVIPAQVAGVKEIVLCTPPAGTDGLPHVGVLAACFMLGVTEVYRVGGAQAIAAMAYGTESISRVDKIVGPGNLYVALAKREVMGDVGIDSLAGPSEVFIVADETANPAYVAADMLAQAEHDVEAGAVCVSTSNRLLCQVEEELKQQLASLPREAIAKAALTRWGALVLADSLDEALAVVNASAPEHVEVMVTDAESLLPGIRQAGAVFFGAHTPEAVGDYFAGTNHVLPTHGSARYASGLSVYDFLRRMSYVEYTEAALRAHLLPIQTLAMSESLEGHARSVQIRFQEVHTRGKS